jgi:hypothetical protein
MKKNYVRVSTILSGLQEFDHIDPIVLAAKATIGTNVHEAIEDNFNNKIKMLSPRETHYFNSFLKWKGVMNPNIILQENRYYDDDKMFTGKVDAVIKLPYEKIPILVDWKTSATENAMIWSYQAHFYHHLLVKNGVSFIADRVLFVKLDSKGNNPKVCVYKIDPSTTAYCLDLVDKYWEKQKKLDENYQEALN